MLTGPVLTVSVKDASHLIDLHKRCPCTRVGFVRLHWFYTQCLVRQSFEYSCLLKRVARSNPVTTTATATIGRMEKSPVHDAPLSKHRRPKEPNEANNGKATEEIIQIMSPDLFESRSTLFSNRMLKGNKVNNAASHERCPVQAQLDQVIYVELQYSMHTHCYLELLRHRGTIVRRYDPLHLFLVPVLASMVVSCPSLPRARVVP
jgi:hypothetical protein